MLLTNDGDNGAESQANDYDDAESQTQDDECYDDEPGSTNGNDLTIVPRRNYPKLEMSVNNNTVSQNLQSRIRMQNKNNNGETQQYVERQSTNDVHSEDYDNNKDNITCLQSRYNEALHVPKFAMNFRDIEDTIRNFDGSKNLSIRSWLEEFEENARVMCWDEFQMFIFAKRSLKGLAKLFISTERGITSYQQLKKALLDEFDTVVKSCQLHKMLMERKMSKNETVEEKKGKQEGELHTIPKGDIPLQTYHIDHLGPLESTSKMHNHIFAVIDAFTKFCWLYPTKTTSAREVITKLQQQSLTFGNPVNVISDRGSAFTSEDFKNYCDTENINHMKITAGLPRANGQIERLNSVIISVLSKLSIADPTKWYKYVGDVQRIINSTYHRRIKSTPFELLVGIKMRTKDDVKIKELIEEEFMRAYDEDRNELRQKAKQQILDVQAENVRTYNFRRRAATKYKIGDLVAIKRIQLGGGLKLKPKYLGPYRIIKVKPNDTYDVIKCGNNEGPKQTTTCAGFIKPWPRGEYDDDELFSQDGRVVETEV
ncbi:uncharacterized protein LOC131805713 [Musca domestica]|uniref:Uncharacterized protein LOC131805713 n=1 Tax=Musca domestica TaxID=7370 RepID=A0ABM3VHG5_MUSDO|nr:uncharacterized protein LOC131805713 [Musca domestica]